MMQGYRSTGHAMFAGENRPYGAMITYAANASEDGSVTVEISDDRGDVVYDTTASPARGLNRIVWNLRRRGFAAPDGDGDEPEEGPEVLPGTYHVRTVAGSDTSETTLAIIPDPRLQIAPADRRAKSDALLAVGARMNQSHRLVGNIRQLEDAVQRVLEELGDRDREDLRAAGAALEDSLGALVGQIVRQAEGPGLFGRGNLVAGQLRNLYSSLDSSWDRPTDAQETAMMRVSARLDALVASFNGLAVREAVQFRDAARAAGLDLVPTVEPIR